MFPPSPQRPGHQRSPDRTAKPLAKPVCGKAGGLHPARMLGSQDRAGREASAQNPEKLFRLLSGFENSPILSPGRSDNSRCAGAGGGTDRGDLDGRWPAPSLRTARCVTDGSMGLPFPTSKTATCLAPGGRLSAQRLDQPDEITDQRPRHGATGRDCGLWAAVFVANASLSRFGERQPHNSNSGVKGGSPSHKREHSKVQIRARPSNERHCVFAVRNHFLPTISYHFSGSSEAKICRNQPQNSSCRKTGAVSSCVSKA